jgi:hypothetical protein
MSLYGGQRFEIEALFDIIGMCEGDFAVVERLR